MIVTFYSFKGGVGRSMALVNVGEILADWGYRVILCDWDLEAPGLERYLVDGRKAGGASPEIAGWLARPGLIDLLQEYKETLAKPPELAEPGQPSPEVPSTHQVVGKVTLRRPSSHAVLTSSERRRPGSLSLLTAGRRDGDFYNRYAEVVRAFDWDEFYEKWAGDAYMDFFRLDLAGDPKAGKPGAADIVLIDSRTGVTEQGGVCTHHLADLVVLLSAANELNLEGALWMARALADPRLVEVRDGRPLQILPVPSRIEQTAQKEELVTFRRRFRREFRRYIPAAVGRAEELALRAEIPYMPFYSFTERVVAREPESQREQKLYAAYVALADGIVRCGGASGLLPEINAQGRVVRSSLPSYTETSERPKGLILLGYAAADRSMAEIVAQGMSAAGVQVWADFLAQQAGNPWQDSVLRALEVCTGYVLLLGPGGISPSLRAEIDYALNRQAAQPEFRIVPVELPGGDTQSLGPLAGLYAFPLPSGFSPGSSEATEFFTSLAAELSVPGTDSSPAVDEKVPPYRGLRSFDESQARFFFGRAAEIQELMGRLGQARLGGVRWVQIEGASGVGKSSFVSAGLVPAVRRGWIPGTSKSWIVASCRPGLDPLASLTAALDRPEGMAPSERQARLAASERGLCDLVRAATSGGESFLLVIDQLEELLSLADAGKRAQTDALLATALEDPALPFYLVTTLRSDALDRLTELPRLQGLLNRGAVRHQLRPLSEETLRETMTAPAKLAGLTFESGLAERILRDLRPGPPSPALLGLLLSRLWESRSGNLLTHEAYDRLGGIDGVLAESAERFFAGLPEDDQKRARALLLQLVTAQGVRQSRLCDEVVAAAGGGPGTKEVLRRLIAAQVVTLSGDRVELAHDALLSSWPRLAAWVDQERDALRRRDELESAALAWTNAGEPADGLPSGPQLAYFAPAPARSKLAINYLEAARRREWQLKRLKKINTLAKTTAAILILGLIAGGVAAWNRIQTKRSQDLARHALEILKTDPTTGLELAIQSAQISDTLPAKTALREAIQSARTQAVLTNDGPLNLAVFSPDGHWILTAGARGATLWQLAPLRLPQRFNADGILVSAAFTADGRRVLTLSDSGEITEWALDTDNRRELISGLRQPSLDQLLQALKKVDPGQAASDFSALVAMSSIGGNLAVSGNRTWAAWWDDQAVHLWDLRKWPLDEEPSRLKFHRITVETREKVTRVIFSQNSNHLAVVTGGSEIDVWSVNVDGVTRNLWRGSVPEQAEPLKIVALSPDGNLLITARGDSLAPTLWDLRTGAPRAVLYGHRERVLSAVFSPDGGKLATTSADGTAHVWDVSTGKETAALRGHTGAVIMAAFSPDGRRLVTVGIDDTARIWDLTEPPEIQDDSLASLIKQAEARVPAILGANKGLLEY